MERKNLGKKIGVFLLILIALISVITAIVNKKSTETSLIASVDPELAVTRTYEQFIEGDEKVDGTDNVTFSAFFLSDLDGDGYAEKVKGSCIELGNKDTLYMEIVVRTEGYVENGRIEINGKNFYLHTVIPEDNEVESNCFEKNQRIISFKKLNNGIQKLLLGNVISSYGTPDINNSLRGMINNYSRNDNKIVFTGTYVNGENERINIRKEIDLTVDWYGNAETSIEPHNRNYSLYKILEEGTETIELKETLKVICRPSALFVKSNHVKGVIPKYNGYSPVNVKIGNSDDTFTYNSETGEFEIERSSILNEDNTFKKLLNYTQNYQIVVEYPKEAYDFYTKPDIKIAIDLETYFELYNNPNEEFEKPYITNVAEETFLIWYTFPADRSSEFEVDVGYRRDKPIPRYFVKKDKPLKIYNGLSYEEIEDYYPINWRVYIGDSDVNKKIIITERNINGIIEGDYFIRKDNTIESMENVSSIIGLNFQYVFDALGSDGWVKVIDEETDIVLVELRGDEIKNFSKNTYYFDTPVKHIRIETSEIQKSGNIYFRFIKELDDNYILENYTREEFDALDTINSNATLYFVNGKNIKKNGFAHYEENYYVLEVKSSLKGIATPVYYDNENIQIDVLADEADHIIGWENGIILLKMPKQIYDLKLKEISIDNENVRIISNEVIEKDGNIFIKIYTETNSAQSFSILLRIECCCDPMETSGGGKIEAYGKNFGYGIPGCPVEDIYDLDNNNNSEEMVTYSHFKIDFIAPNVLITSQRISNYNFTGEIVYAPKLAEVRSLYDGNPNIKKTARITALIKNNYSNTVSEIKILGKIPFEGNTYILSDNLLGSTFSTMMTEDGVVIPSDFTGNVTIYYSENENPNKELSDISNAWKTAENVTDWSKIKTYLIDLEDTLIDTDEELEFYYDVEIPRNINVGKKSFSEHAVYFCLDTDQGKYRTQTEPSKTGLIIAPVYDVEITKYQKNKDLTIEGVTYKITKKDLEDGDEVFTATTDQNGKIYLNKIYGEATYELEEISVSDDYELNPEKVVFIGHIDKNTGNVTVAKISGSIRDNIEVINNGDNKYKALINLEDEAKLKVKVVKKEKDSETVIKNARFLINGEGLPISGFVLNTNIQGEAIVSGLSIGKEYTLLEKKAEGYYLDTALSFIVRNDNELSVDVTDSGETIKRTYFEEDSNGLPILVIELEDEKIPRYNLKINKISKVIETKDSLEETFAEDNIERLEGATFKLYKGRELIGTYVTDENGIIEIYDLYQFEALRNIDQSYKLVETIPPNGYSKIKDTHFYVEKNDEGLVFVENNLDGNDRYYTVEDNTINLYIEDNPKIKFIKKDGETGEILSNTKFAIYNISEGVEPAKNSKGGIIGDLEEINGKEYFVVKTNENGEITLDLSEGVYKAVEVESEEKYDIENKEYYFGIGANAEEKNGLKVEWVKPIAGTGVEVLNGNILLDNGEFLSYGYYTNSLKIGENIELESDNAYRKGLITKNDKYGNAWEVKTITGLGNSEIIDMIKTNDNRFIAIGTITADAEVSDGITLNSGENLTSFIIKFDEQGNVVWSKTLAGTGVVKLNKIKEKDDGKLIAVGSFADTLELENNDILNSVGQEDCLIVELDSNGNITKGRAFGGLNNDSITSIDLNQNNDYVIMGDFLGTITLENGVEIDGKTSYTTDIFVVKYDNLDTISWYKIIGGTDSEYSKQIKYLNNNEIFVCGLYKSKNIQLGLEEIINHSMQGNNNNYYDILLVRYSNDGNLEFYNSLSVKCYGNKPVALEMTNDGGYIFGINTTSSFNIYPDVSITPKGTLLIKYNAYDEIENIRNLTTNTSSYNKTKDIVSIKEVENNNYLLCLKSDVDLTIDSMDYVNKGMNDSYIIKILKTPLKTMLFKNANSFGGEGNEVYTDICKTDDGGYVTVGRFEGNQFDIGNTSIPNLGRTDGFIVKYDKSGACEWTGHIGGSSNDYITGVTQLSDGGIVVIGYTDSRLLKIDDIEINSRNNLRMSFIVKYKDGIVEWYKVSNDSGNGQAYYLIDSLENNCYVYGLLTAGSSRLYMIYKFDSNGNQSFFATIVEEKVFSSMSVNENEDIFVSASWDDSYYVGYSVDGTSSLIRKYDKNGNQIWNRKYLSYRDMKDTEFMNVFATKDGGCYAVVRASNGEASFGVGPSGSGSFIVKYNKDGNIEWVKKADGSGTIRLNSIDITNDDGFIVAGHYYGNVVENNEYCIVNPHNTSYGTIVQKYDKEGNFEWQDGFERNNSNISSKVIELSRDRYALIGAFNDERLTLGDRTLINNESSTNDIFITQFSPIMAFNDEQEVVIENYRKEFDIKTKIEQIDGVKGGKISGENFEPYERIKYGDSSINEIRVTPDQDYEIISIKVNGEDIDFEPLSDGSFVLPQFENVTENYTVTAKFAYKDNKITINKIDSVTGERLTDATFRLDQIDERVEPGNDVFETVTSVDGYEYTFVEENGQYISNNQGVDSSEARAIIEINLENYFGKYILSLDYRVSSQSGYDYGRVYLYTSADLTGTNYNIVNNSGETGNTQTRELDGGTKYYLLFTYRKNDSESSGEDRFIISNLKMLLSGSELYHTTVETNQNGQAITQVPFGKYTITEENAPEGYELGVPKEIEFRSFDGAQHEFNFEDEKLGKVIVHHYIKGTTTSICDDEIIEGKQGESYIAYPRIDVGNYKLEVINEKEVLPENMRGTFEYNDQEVVFNYIHGGIPVVVNHYIEETMTPVPLSDGSSAEQVLDLKNVGDSYSTEPLDNIDETYELSEIPENKDGIVGEEEVIVNYYYKKVFRDLTITKVDSETRELLEGVEFNIYEGTKGKLDIPDAVDVGIEETKLVADKGNIVGDVPVILESEEYNYSPSFVRVDNKIVPQTCGWYKNNYDSNAANGYNNVSDCIYVDLTEKTGYYIVSFDIKMNNNNINCNMQGNIYDNNNSGGFNYIGETNKHIEYILEGNQWCYINLYYYNYDTNLEDYAAIENFEIYEANNVEYKTFNEIQKIPSDIIEEEIPLEINVHSMSDMPFVVEDGKIIPSTCQKYINENGRVGTDNYSYGYFEIDLSNLEGFYRLDSKVSYIGENDDFEGGIVDNYSNYEDIFYYYMTGSGDYQKVLKGGEKYYYEFYYVKQSPEDVEDYAEISNIKLYKLEDSNTEIKFNKISNTQYEANVMGFNDYYPEARIPIDLIGKEGEYKLVVNASMSSNDSNDYGEIFVNDDYGNYLGDIGLRENDEEEFECILEGGQKYYLGFWFYKESMDPENKFTIKNISLETLELDRIITDENGKASISVPAGKYTIEERKAPLGYKLQDDNLIEFIVSADNYELTIENTKTKGQVIVHHYLEGTENPILLNDKTLCEDEVKEGNVGDIYATKAKENAMNYYYVVDTEGETSGEYIDGIIEVTYYYAIDPTKDKDVSYTINYYKDDSEEPLDTQVVETTIKALETEIPVDKNNIVIDKFEGYVIDENRTNIPDTIEDGGTINVYYKPKEIQLIIHYKAKGDETENTLIPDEIVTTRYDEVLYLIDYVKEIEGYVLDEDFQDEEILINADSVERTIYYEPVSKVVVHHIARDGDNETELGIDEIENIVGKTITTYPKDFPGYIVEERPESEVIEVTKEVKDVYYYYKKVPSGVIEKHIDNESGNVLYEEYHEIEIGESYDIKPKEILEYVLDENKLPEKPSGVMEENEVIEVKYYYNKETKVVVHYIYKEGNEETEIETVEIPGYVTKDYETEQKEYNDYNYLNSSDNTSGKMTKEIIDVYYYYNKDTKVIVHYIERTKENNTLVEKEIETIEIEGKIGQDYEAVQKEYDDLEFKEDSGNTQGKMTKEVIDVYYYYAKPAQVVVKYLDIATGEPIEDPEDIPGYVGDEYKTTGKDIDDYVLVEDTKNTEGEMGEETIEVIYYYSPKADVNVKYIDKDTGKEISIEENIDGYIGKDYTTSKKTIKDYEFVEDTKNTSGKMKEKHTEVIYYYKAKEVPKPPVENTVKPDVPKEEPVQDTSTIMIVNNNIINNYYNEEPPKEQVVVITDNGGTRQEQVTQSSGTASSTDSKYDDSEKVYPKEYKATPKNSDVPNTGDRIVIIAINVICVVIGLNIILKAINYRRNKKE